MKSGVKIKKPNILIPYRYIIDKIIVKSSIKLFFSVEKFLFLLALKKNCFTANRKLNTINKINITLGSNKEFEPSDIIFILSNLKKYR